MTDESNRPLVVRINTDLLVQLPRVPDFFRLDYPQDSAQMQRSVPIEMINEDALRDLGKRWTDALVDRAADQRDRRKRS